MNIRKAVITAGGRGIRLYPAWDTVQKAMLPFIDRDGLNKPAIQIIAEEALDSGIEEICVVCAPGDEFRYKERFEALRNNLLAAYQGVEWAQKQEERVKNLLKRLHFAPQESPRGYGHAVFCAKEFVGQEPFLLLLGDHLYISHVKEKRCAQQLIDLAIKEECSVAAVQATPEHLVRNYGTVGGKRESRLQGVYHIERILEKPTLSKAELELHIPGLRMGYYLCFFGMHVLTHNIFQILEESINRIETKQGEVQLTPALEELARREKYLALELKGYRYDIGARFGMMKAQLALSLAGMDHDEALMELVDLLAEVKRSRVDVSGG
jgi:UTP--glucose-1-phosphate uridylyltransferase